MLMKLQGLLVLKCLLSPLIVIGQGTIYFSNYVPGRGVDAPVYVVHPDDTCERCAGDRFLAQLYAGPIGSTRDSLTPVGASVPFLTGALAGYFDGGADPLRVIPNVLSGLPAVFEVRAWSAVDGATWEQAFTKCGGGGVCPGRSVLFTVITGDPLTPAYLGGLQSFQMGALARCVPEPSTRALLLLSAVILGARLRRR